MTTIMNLREAINKNDYLLMEAAVIETLRREGKLSLHPHLEHAPLIYDQNGKESLLQIYSKYISIAQKADVPILICSPTWRTNLQRVRDANFLKEINQDAVHFLQNLRESLQNNSPKVFIGGLIGCKNDCYKPEEALSLDKAREFHSWQITKLVDAGVDFLFAATMPCLSEAAGIALAMKVTKTPYIISFVINTNSLILDGTDLDKACKEIDSLTNDNPPLGYMINCSHPSFLRLEDQNEYLLKRLIGFQANASSKDHAELESSTTLQVDSIDDWGERMIAFNRKYGIKVLGGCCGTGAKHLEYIVHRIKSA